MMPLTIDRPKSLLVAAGHPVIDPMMDALKAARARDITVVVGHGHEALQGYHGNGARHGLSVQYVHQPRPAGPADALRRLDMTALPDCVPVLPADGWMSEKLVKSLLDGTDPAAVRALDGFQPRHGLPIVNGGRLERVDEAHPSQTNAVALAGAYRLPRELLETLPADHYGLRGALNGHMEAHGPWKVLDARRSDLADLVTGHDLIELNSRLMPRCLDQREGTIHSSAVLEGNIQLGPNSTIGPGAVLQGPVVLGDHCHVGAGAILGPGTSARNHVRIDAGAVLSDCALASNIHVGAQSQIERAYLANGARLGRRVLCAGTNGIIIGPDDKVDDGAVILDGVLGHNSHIHAGRTVQNVPDNGVAV